MSDDITIRGLSGQGRRSPAVVILRPGHTDSDLNQAANLIRELTGTDPMAYVDNTGTAAIHASGARAYPQPANPGRTIRIANRDTQEYGTLEGLSYSPTTGKIIATVLYDGDSRLTDIPLSELTPEG